MHRDRLYFQHLTQVHTSSIVEVVVLKVQVHQRVVVVQGSGQHSNLIQMQKAIFQTQLCKMIFWRDECLLQ